MLCPELLQLGTLEYTKKEEIQRPTPRTINIIALKGTCHTYVTIHDHIVWLDATVANHDDVSC